eukprot:7809876-Pyramimonas_sp.AAC.2
MSGLRIDDRRSSNSPSSEEAYAHCTLVPITTVCDRCVLPYLTQTYNYNLQIRPAADAQRSSECSSSTERAARYRNVDRVCRFVQPAEAPVQLTTRTSTASLPTTQVGKAAPPVYRLSIDRTSSIDNRSIVSSIE